MKQETQGTVISVSRQWWLKVNRKAFRAHSLDGALFPHIIKVRYSVNGETYTCRKWIDPGSPVPPEGSTVSVFYSPDKPSRGKIQL